MISMATGISLARRFAPYLLGVVMLAGVVVIIYRQGVVHTTDKYEAKLGALKAAHAQALADQIAINRQLEHDMAERMAAIDLAKQGELNAEIQKREATIAGLRSGAVQLRKRFTCPSNSHSTGGQASTGASVGDAGTAGGLQNQDGEFFIREAARADEIVIQLQACQAIVRSDRQSK